MWFEVGLGVVVLAVGASLLWWSARREATVARSVAVVAGAVLTFLGLFTTGVLLWATTATDTSQFARTLVWGESGFGDQDRFPARVISAGPDPLEFEAVADSAVTGYPVPGSSLELGDFLEQNDTTAFVVLSDDGLLYEGYFNGSAADAMQTSFSVAKSFIATLIGIAIDDGHLAGLDEPVTDWVPELLERDARFENITLHHLITMSSGLSFDDGASPWADPANTYHGTDLRNAVLTTPTIERPPGEVFHYNDWNVILLGLVLERATQTSISEFTATSLWQPMGAEADGSWSLDSELHGFEKSFVGVNGRAIDFAKLGWLYLNDGRIGETEVLSPGFIADATHLDTTTDPAAEYQYLWWIDQDRDAYYANGDHGQLVYVDPAARIVVVRHGTSGELDWLAFIGGLIDWINEQPT